MAGGSGNKNGNKNSNKRSLETDKGISPPAKMAARNVEAKLDEVLAKLDSMESRFTNLETRFTNLEKEVAGINRALAELEAVKEEVETMRETCHGFQRLEIETKKRSVLLRGLKFKTQGKFETRMQTKEVLAGFFERLEMVPHLVDYQRLGGLRENEDGSKVSVRVQFADVDQKFQLFDKIKLKGNEMKDVSILTDYPVFQLQEFKNLSGLAYNLRKDNPGTKTRVVPKGLGLILQKKVNGSDQWTKVSAPAGGPSSSFLE